MSTWKRMLTLKIDYSHWDSNVWQTRFFFIFHRLFLEQDSRFERVLKRLKIKTLTIALSKGRLNLFSDIPEDL